MLNLRKIADEVNAQVTFVGDIAQEYLARYYNRSKSFVLNSNFEASSYSLIEAMACALPVIASKNTGSAEVVRHELDGYLIDTEYTLQRALSDLFTNEKLAIEMGKSGRERVTALFNSDTNFQTITDAISQESR